MINKSIISHSLIIGLICILFIALTYHASNGGESDATAVFAVT